MLSCYSTIRRLLLWKIIILGKKNTKIFTLQFPFLNGILNIFLDIKEQNSKHQFYRPLGNLFGKLGKSFPALKRKRKLWQAATQERWVNQNICKVDVILSQLSNFSVNNPLLLRTPRDINWNSCTPQHSLYIPPPPEALPPSPPDPPVLYDALSEISSPQQIAFMSHLSS